MICARFVPILILYGALVRAALAGAPTLTFPENDSRDQPGDLTLSWEAGALMNYVKNGSFEQNFTGWSVSAPWKVALYNDAPEIVDGRAFATIYPSDRNQVNGASLTTKVTLPKKGTSAILTWSDFTSGTLIDGQLNSNVRWQVIASNGATVVPLQDRIGGDNDLGWQRQQADVTSLLGKQFTLAFYFSNNFNIGRGHFDGNVTLDDVRLEVTPESVSYEIYLGSTSNLGAGQLLGKTTEGYWDLSGLAAGSTNYWKVIQITDGVRESSPVHQFVVGGSVPVEAPPLRVELSGGQLHLHATTQAGGFYQFEQAGAPDADAWQPIGDEITGDGAETSVDVALAAEAQFFRIRVTR